MKKVLIVFALLAFGFSNAQKGSILVSGSVNYSSTSSGNLAATDYNFLSISPRVGYQFADSWTVGVESSLSQSKYTVDDTNYENKIANFSVGSFLRYSKSLTDTFSLFTDLGVGIQNRKETLSTESFSYPDIKANGFYANLSPLLHLKVKNGFGLNFGLGGISYNSLDYKDSREKVNNFNVNFGQAFTLGIQKNF
jgi:hypothetical protein